LSWFLLLSSCVFLSSYCLGSWFLCLDTCVFFSFIVETKQIRLLLLTARRQTVPITGSMGKAEEYGRKERELHREVLTGNEQISPGVFLLSVKRRFDFVPGQVVKLAVDRKEPPRIYSVCSGSKEDELKILYNVKEGGYLTPRLAGLDRGDEVLVSSPYGGFRGGEGPAWWVAAGTGIAPFYSMYRTGLAPGKHLVHGVSFLNQLYFRAEFEEALGPAYHPCCSREAAGGAFAGRVTDFLRSRDELPANELWYLCGKALMVVEVRDLLIDRGIPYENIVAEIYF